MSAILSDDVLDKFDAARSWVWRHNPIVQYHVRAARAEGKRAFDIGRDVERTALGLEPKYSDYYKV